MIKHQTYIKVEPEKVYNILTTAQGWNAWFTDSTIIDLRSDGTGDIRLRWSNIGSGQVEIEDGGKILETIRNKSFSFQWAPGKNKTTVKFHLQPLKEGTLLVLKEEGYTNSHKDIEACIKCAIGWGEALTLLKIYLEHGIVYKEDLFL